MQAATTTTTTTASTVVDADSVKQVDIDTAENGGLPPSYDNVTQSPSTSQHADLPPAYDSIVNKLKRAKNDSNNTYEYVNNVSNVFCSSVSVTLSFAIGIALPLAMLIIGVIYKDECAIQEKIPIWLIVSGSIGSFQIVLRTIINAIVIYKKRKEPEYEIKYKGCFTCILDLFILSWFICGNVWVYGNRSLVSFNSLDGDKYCNQTCYLFAFWVITATWILFASICCCCCALVCLFSVKKANE